MSEITDLEEIFKRTVESIEPERGKIKRYCKVILFSSALKLYNKNTEMSKKLLEPFSRIGISCGNFG
jgi:hypothetical protein